MVDGIVVAAPDLPGAAAEVWHVSSGERVSMGVDVGVGAGEEPSHVPVRATDAPTYGVGAIGPAAGLPHRVQRCRI